MSISLCCIVKNEQQFIADMLLSVKGLADELIVVDTGAEDSTIEIAKDLGASVFSYDWNYDFAAARNFSVSKASRDWILILDADERLEATDHQKILELIALNKKSAFFLQRRHYVSHYSVPHFRLLDSSDPHVQLGALGYFVTSDLRLFPREPQVLFEGAVHESAEESAVRQSLEISHQEIVIHHLGPLLAQERLKQKNYLYLALAKKKLAENPEDWRNWFQVGAELQGCEDFEGAFEHFKKATQLSPEIAENWRQAGICLAAIGQFTESLDFLNKAINIKPDCTITLNALGVGFKNLGMEAEATTCFEAVLTIEPGNLISRQNLQDLKGI